MNLTELWNELGAKIGALSSGDSEIIKLASGEGEFEVEVARSGKFKAVGGQLVNLTPKLLGELAGTFDPKVFRPQNKLGHPPSSKTDTPSMGPITGLRYDVKKDRLLAKLDPTPELRQHIKEKRFTERSIEYEENWRDTDKAVLTGLGWLGATSPAVDSLAALAEGIDKDHTVIVMATGKPIEAADTDEKLPEERKPKAAAQTPLEDGKMEETAVKLAETEKEVERLRAQVMTGAKDRAKVFMAANVKKIPMALVKFGLEDKLAALFAAEAARPTVVTLSEGGKETKLSVADMVTSLIDALPEQIKASEEKETAKEEDAATAKDRAKKFAGINVSEASVEMHEEIEKEIAAEKARGNVLSYSDGARRIAMREQE